MSDYLATIAVAVVIAVTLVNLGLLVISLKLYTEVFKEMAQRARRP